MSKSQTILPNENDLFNQMARGSVSAFTEIFYHYTQRLYSFILIKTKSEDLTEEIIQEVFIKIWDKREKFSEVENFESYLYTLASNKIYDFYRKMASEDKLKKMVFQSMKDYSNITTETLDLKYSQEELTKALDRLPPQQKKIFLLSRQQGLNHMEIAEQLQISPSTVNNHLTVALRSLKNYIQSTQADSFILLLILLKINNQ